MSLLDRVLGRSSRDDRERDAAAREAATADGAVLGRGVEAADAAAARASVVEALRRQVAQGSHGRLRAHEVREDAPLFDRGYLDSFSYVEFLTFIEAAYSVRIEDSQLAGHLTTIAAMADHILEQRPPEAA